MTLPLSKYSDTMKEFHFILKFEFITQVQIFHISFFVYTLGIRRKRDGARGAHHIKRRPSRTTRSEWSFDGAAQEADHSSRACSESVDNIHGRANFWTRRQSRSNCDENSQEYGGHGQDRSVHYPST